MSLVGATLRWRVEGLEHYDAAVRGGRQPILGFWHGRILPATVYFRDRGIVVMTSRNFDGEWIARIIERFGYGTARGSSTRGGPQALRELTRALQRRPAGRASRWTGRAVRRARHSLARCGWPGPPGTLCYRSTSKRREPGRRAVGTARRSPSRSAPWRWPWASR